MRSSLSLPALLLVVAAALWATVPDAATAAAPVAAARGILVSVDDLPVASPKLHKDAADRKEVTRKLLAILAKHKV